MPVGAFRGLMSHLGDAGYQEDKDRGTWQHTTITEYEEAGGELGEFIADHRAAIAELDIEEKNEFLNCNGGRKIKTWHQDSFSQVPRLARRTPAPRATPP